MKKLAIEFLAAVLLIVVLCVHALAATNVWLFYGLGGQWTSPGIDQIARKARTLSGVGRVATYNYTQTQQVYNEILASPPGDQVVIVGYSCGGNSAAVVSSSLPRPNYIAGIQPSLWCGSYSTAANTRVAQDTYASCAMTWGLGCAKYYGAAQKIVLIERPDLHPDADTDPNTQADVLGLIYAVANPSRAHFAINRLARSAHFVRYNGQKVWLRER